MDRTLNQTLIQTFRYLESLVQINTQLMNDLHAADAAAPSGDSGLAARAALLAQVMKETAKGPLRFYQPHIQLYQSVRAEVKSFN